MFLQDCALLLAESRMYTTTLYHNAPPIYIAIPPAQNQYMQDKILGESIFRANACEACICTRRNTANYH